MKRHELYIGGEYRNLKNKKIYTVTGFAKHSETYEQLVIYHQLVDGTTDDSGGTQFPWARPLMLFLEKFERFDARCQNPQCTGLVKGLELYCSDECASMSTTDQGFPPLEVMDELKHTPIYLRKTQEQLDDDYGLDDGYDYDWDWPQEF